MKTLTQKQFDVLVERWNAKTRRGPSRLQCANQCRDEGHAYAVSPLTAADGSAVLVCTRCLKYVNAERSAA